MEGFLTKLRCRGTTGRAQGPSTAGRGAVAQLGPERTRGGSCRVWAGQENPVGLVTMREASPVGSGHWENAFSSCQSFVLGSPKQKPRADRRDRKGRHREANRREQHLPCEEVRVQPGLWGWNLRVMVMPRL